MTERSENIVGMRKKIKAQAEHIRRLEQRIRELKQAEQQPIGYIQKTDLARLRDPIPWDGTYLSIGVDHFDQWREDTPYDHLAPIYAAPIAQTTKGDDQ